MSRGMNRRELLRCASVAGVGALLSPGRAWSQGQSPNEKLDVAVVGCGGRGAGDLAGVAATDSNIVALCDVDDGRAAGAFNQHPKAKKFRDFRKMLDAIHKEIDAVVVATPDHVHAPASMAAMKLGKHVYCEKPLTHSVYEARMMTETAARQKVATQMGTQHHCTEGYRRSVEFIQAGAIGDVREVHCWTDRPAGWWPQGVPRPKDTPPVPAGLDWDLWLGPAPERPYHPAYAPFKWRGWWDFGTGAMGDMAIHICNVAFWALKLGAPSAVEVEHSEETPEAFAETYPKWTVLTYYFPARDKLPPVKLVWYDAKRMPPAEVSEGINLGDNGTLFVGSEGKMLAPIGTSPMLWPKEKFADYKRPEKTLPRLHDIHKVWVESCKTGQPAGCHFGYAGPMTEALLVGNLALRVSKRIEWDPVQMKVTNVPEANQYVRREYRKGWEL